MIYNRNPRNNHHINHYRGKQLYRYEHLSNPTFNLIGWVTSKAFHLFIALLFAVAIGGYSFKTYADNQVVQATKAQQQKKGLKAKARKWRKVKAHRARYAAKYTRKGKGKYKGPKLQQAQRQKTTPLTVEQKAQAQAVLNDMLALQEGAIPENKVVLYDEIKGNKDITAKQVETVVTKPTARITKAEARTLAANAASLRENPTQSETNCLARAMYYEARDDSVAGQTAVADVILNRVAFKGYFKDTVCTVIAQKGQFQWYHNASLRGKVPFNPKTHSHLVTLAEDILNKHKAGKRVDSTGGAYFFSSNGVRPAPAAVYHKHIGAHAFYKLSAKWQAMHARLVSM